MSDAAAFLAAATEPSSTSRIPASDLYAAYAEWCEGRNETPMAPVAFGKRVTTAGYKRIRPGGKSHRQGLRLKRKAGPIGIVRPAVEVEVDSRRFTAAGEAARQASEVPGVYGDDGRPAPPEHLSPKTAAWWSKLAEEYDLTEAHLRMITNACEQWDIGQRALAEVIEAGPTIDAPSGQRAHPGISVHAQASKALGIMLKQLGLDAAGKPE